MLNPLAGSPRGLLRHRRVLVVEDEALVAMTIEDDLREAGAASVGWAADLPAALWWVAERGGEVDAAVLDLNLGGASALPVGRALGERRIPFVVATGQGGEAIPGLPGAPVLAKPFAPEALVAALATLARRPPGPLAPALGCPASAATAAPAE